MSVAFRHERRPAWRVVRALERGLHEQSRHGALTVVTALDADGRVVVHGTVDLAALAQIAEHALRAEFKL